MIQAIDIVKTFEDGITVLNHIDATFEDGKVNMMDYIKLKQHAQGTSSIWE